MSTHAPTTRTILVLALGLVLGLTAGTTTADAAGITKAAVRKIAAKVVAQRAPGLSVSHAGTADHAAAADHAGTAGSATDAATLTGYSAAQLLTTGYRYPLPSEAFVTARRYSFPGLPVGTYLASYTYSANTTLTATTLQCWIETTGSSAPYELNSYGQSVGLQYNRGSASGIITTTPTTDLYCSATTGSYSFLPSSGAGSAVSFVPLDNPVDRTATTTAARSAHGADVVRRGGR